jgi:large subunit ribosomal protein L18
MIRIVSKKARRRIRSKHMRRKISGTAERPRLCVRVSNRRIYAQLIDDTSSRILAGVSTLDGTVKSTKSVECATKLGQRVAAAAVEKGIKAVVFDRGGFRYHGRLKALADAARAGGLRF